MLRRALLALSVLPLAAGAQGVVRERDPRHPAPLSAALGCELWQGTVAGNDPRGEATLQLCTEGTVVTGVFHWSSPEAGWDRRSLGGRWDAARARFELRDTAMLEAHPAVGWRLCMADQYSLTLTPQGTLEGVFASHDCDDTGRLVLRRARHATGPTDASIGLATPAPPSGRPSGCSVVPGGLGGGVGGWGWALWGLCALWQGRRRGRSAFAE